MVEVEIKALEAEGQRGQWRARMGSRWIKQNVESQVRVLKDSEMFSECEGEQKVLSSVQLVCTSRSRVQAATCHCHATDYSR